MNQNTTILFPKCIPEFSFLSPDQNRLVQHHEETKNIVGNFSDGTAG
jgi:hypothetical protein